MDKLNYTGEHSGAFFWGVGWGVGGSLYNMANSVPSNSNKLSFAVAT